MMQDLLDIVLPVFLVIGFGYAAVWKGLLSDDAIDSLMGFTQNFAIPCLLFRAIASIDIGETFDPALLGSYFTGATFGFIAGLLGARFLFERPWEDSIAIGFCTLYSNSVLLGLPITERAYGTGSLGPNYAIVALHAPFCYVLGFTAMEVARAHRAGLRGAARSVFASVTRNALMIGIGLGFLANLTDFHIPSALGESVDLIATAALPAALFGLGGVLRRYRPDGDSRAIAYVCVVSLAFQPTVVWFAGSVSGLADGQLRSAVLTSAMAPGVNAYLFANMYGVAKRVVASSVLLATAFSIGSAWFWLGLLP